jgi:hypothetical protein
VQITGPISRNSDAWTITWGTENDERSYSFVEDPSSHRLFLGAISYTSGIDFIGIVVSFSKNGDHLWTSELNQFVNAIPRAMVFSQTFNRLYIAASVYNIERAIDDLMLLEYDADFGNFLNATLICSPFYDHVVMGWSSIGQLIIAAEVPYLNIGSQINLTQYNPETRILSSPYMVSRYDNLWNMPIGIIANGPDSQTYLLQGSYVNLNSAPSTHIIKLDLRGFSVQFVQDLLIDTNSTNFFPIGFVTYGNKFYLGVSQGFTTQILKFTTNLQIERYTNLNTINCTWHSISVNNSGSIILIGSGTNSFNQGPIIGRQGIIAFIQDNPTAFELVKVDLFGRPDLNDFLTGVYRSTRGEIFLIGYGKSYGNNLNNNDYDGYLIKYIEIFDSTTNSKSEEPPTNSRLYMWLGIIGFTIIFAVINIIERKKNNA